ncbi:MAG: polyprenyl synthetase family protein [Acidobacteriota bacterium]|nr:MAG: polyprenyl synthetase family protein [Acidobacteriota bacterium]
MSKRLCAFIGQYRETVETALEDHLPLSDQLHASEFNRAVRYAIFPGGKRWRPMLALMGAEIAGANPTKAVRAACAVEYLHTSSIIFDDLPSMDDAGTRRGRDSLHVVFGESVALLAALALFNHSYSLLVHEARENGYCEAGLDLISAAVDCIGANGMIGGQAVDLALKGRGLCPDALVSRNLKTTALMRLTVMAGAAVCGADREDLEALARFGESLGMAYQICDDLLDELGLSDELGKPAGQDNRHGRSTYVAEFGIEGARRQASGFIDQGRRSLVDRFGEQPATALLIDAAGIILDGSGRLIAPVA